MGNDFGFDVEGQLPLLGMHGNLQVASDGHWCRSRVDRILSDFATGRNSMQGTVVMLMALSGLGCHNKYDVAYGPPTYSTFFGMGCYANYYPNYMATAYVPPSCYSPCYADMYNGCYSACYAACYGGGYVSRQHSCCLSRLFGCCGCKSGYRRRSLCGLWLRRLRRSWAV